MASSRSLNSPEAELRHWLQDLILESSFEYSGRELRRTQSYTLSEVTLAGGLPALAIHPTNEDTTRLQQHPSGEEDDDKEYISLTERLAEETLRYAKLRHPNILQFLGVIFPKGSLLPVLLTEQVDTTLNQVLQRVPNLPESLKTSLILDISLGLQMLHESSPALTHGSLSASTVFITPGLTAKLSYPPIYTVFGDTGATTESTSDLSFTSHLQAQLNTSGNGYISSAFTGISNRGFKEDIFSLGELMVHVITQQRPKRIGPGQSPSLVHQTERIDRSHLLRGLIMQCLQKDPVLRPTATEIVQEVKMTTTSRRTQFQDPFKILTSLLGSADNPKDSAPSPKDVRMKRLETENTRLKAQLKVTQSELRHLRVQQTFFGPSGEEEASGGEEEEEEEEEKRRKKTKAASKDVSVQASIIQLNHQKVYIELRKESSDQSFGFSITGGKGAASTLVEGDQSIFITRLATGGLAEKDGRLKPGDKILMVNGIDMSNASRPDALSALMSSSDVCSMVVSREEVVTDPLLDESHQPVRRPRLSTGSKKRLPSRSASTDKLHPLKLGVTLGFDECAPLPEAISNAQGVLYKNKVIVGGHYSDNSGSIFEYDPENDVWGTLTTSPVWFFGLTVFQDKVTVVGGFDSASQSCSAQLYAWNEREGSWLGSLSPMPTARMHPAVVSLGTSLVVAGGRNNKNTLNCVEVFNFASQQWYTAHPLTLEQSSMKGLCHNGFWYLLGGEQQGFPTSRSVRTPLQSLIDSACHKSGSVSCFKAIPSLPNTYSAVTLSGGKIVAIGGSHRDSEDSSDPTSTIYALCEDPYSWLEVGELPDPLSHSCAVPISDEEVLVIGGRYDDGKDTDAVYRMYLKQTSTVALKSAK